MATVNEVGSPGPQSSSLCRGACHIAKHSETGEDMVVYKALYGNFGIWVRPASMWNETVERDGKIYKRFEYIKN